MPQAKTILVIDDDPEFRSVVADFLAEHNWSVIQAPEGDEGVELARSHGPVIVLCDLLMPRCNGLQVCSTIKRDPALRHIRVVISSGRTFEADRQAAFAAGADEFLVKPIDPNQLLSILKRLAQKSPAEPSAPAAPAPEASVLRFWGVRGSIPTPGQGTVKFGGNTSCVELRVPGEIVILDAGTGLRMLGKELAREGADHPMNLTVLLTHTHWDHIQGLPFFQPLFKSSNRIRILGYEGARLDLEGVLNRQMENPFFPIGLREVPANVDIIELHDLQFDVGRLKVEACFANHPGICVGYKVHTPHGTIAFFPDNELSSNDLGQQAKLSAGHLGTKRTPRERIVTFIQNVDVLVMDSQYDCEEYKEHVGWGHGCVDDVVNVAAEAKVKQLFMFHHDPDHDDEKVCQMLDHARDIVQENRWDLKVDAAIEGAFYDLEARKYHT